MRFKRIGHYDVTALIGEGGMGQVYRATDTQLGRDVALKILPDAFAADPDRLARFQREAQVLASLNHPGIAAIYGIEKSDDTQALVLELVEGPTLADRIAKGPIPLDEALPIGKQIAEALEAAHEAGVIHRDLKPANIKVREDGTVKVLDFGLAKAMDMTPKGDPDQSPTLTAAATQMGVILGTAAYMSPEQATGKGADGRSDVWAFGAVLYEMLTGQRAFGGGDVPSTLAAVLKSEPDWHRLPAQTSPAIRRLLRRSLDKNARERLHSVGDARLEIRDVLSGMPSDAPQSQSGEAHGSQPRLAWALVGVFAAVAAAFVVANLLPTARLAQTAMPTARFPAFADSDLGFVQSMALSPDGQYLAFVGTSDARLFVRAIGSLDAVALPGTEGAVNPFWSQDARAIAFFADGELRQVGVSGGPPQLVCELPPETFEISMGGAWNRDGVILFGGLTVGPLFRVAAGGGAPTPFFAEPDTTYRWPQFLPDGQRFLYHGIRESAREDAAIYVGTLDSTRTTRILTSLYQARYVDPGYLLFVRGDALLAQRFDADTLELTGESFAVADRVGLDVNSNRRRADFSVGGGGLVHAAGVGTAQLVWFDRSGAQLGLLGSPEAYYAHELSPDGTRVALEIFDDEGNGEIWVLDVERGTKDRLTGSTPGWEYTPRWAPDSNTVAFSSTFTSDSVLSTQLTQRPADGSGSETVVVELGESFNSTSHLLDWSSDGEHMLFLRDEKLFLISLSDEFADREPSALVETAFPKTGGRISPNGEWLAYVSNESGADEVYIDLMSGGARRRVSTNGGGSPRWSSDGAELYYVGGDRMLTAVRVEQDEFGLPHSLFALPDTAVPGSIGREPYSTIDGERFLIRVGEGAGYVAGLQAGFSPTSITWVLDWTAELER